MRLLILGIGDAFTRLHFGSSALIEAPEGYVLLDCPDLIHRALHEATARAGWIADAGAIDDIIVTHLHGDHCNGLESFGFYRKRLRMEQPSLAVPRLHVAPEIADRVWSRLAPAMDAPFDVDRPSRLEDYFDLRVIDADAEHRVAGLHLRTRATHHPIPTIGLLIRDGDRVLGWSSDTPFEEAHAEWLSAAGLIVHETNYGAAHTPLAKLEALPADIRARLRLIHVPDDFDADATELRALWQGEVVEI